MPAITRLRAVSLGAAALIAAALGDPVVESISNTGIFGRGYRDNVHTSVVPTLVCGIAIVAIVLLSKVFAAFERSAAGSDPVAALARDTIARSPMRAFVPVFALQLVALFAMEHLESLIVAGSQAANGTSWLGGPIVVSLAIHAGLCFAILKIFGSAMRGALAALAALVAIAVAYVLLLGREATATFRRRTGAFGVLRVQDPHVRQLGGRAPPRLATPSHY